MLVGSAAPADMNVDGMIMILTANGALDTTFNTTGYKIYKFDPNSDRPEESLYGAALSPNGMFAAAAGFRNAATQSTATNDDAVLVILPLGGTGTEFAGVVPLSSTSKDRFWAVTFDANNKIVAAGYVADGIDQCLAVARFNTDGTLDTTFGTSGVARVNASPSTASTQLEEARGVVVQSDGKIVVGGIRRALVSANAVSGGLPLSLALSPLRGARGPDLRRAESFGLGTRSCRCRSATSSASDPPGLALITLRSDQRIHNRADPGGHPGRDQGGRP